MPYKQINGWRKCRCCHSSIISYSGSHCSDKKDSSGYSRMEHFKKAHLKLRQLVKPTEAESQHLSVCGSDLQITPSQDSSPD